MLTCSRASNQPIDTRFKVTLKNNITLIAMFQLFTFHFSRLVLRLTSYTKMIIKVVLVHEPQLLQRFNRLYVSFFILRIRQRPWQYLCTFHYFKPCRRYLLIVSVVVVVVWNICGVGQIPVTSVFNFKIPKDTIKRFSRSWTSYLTPAVPFTLIVTSCLLMFLSILSGDEPC